MKCKLIEGSRENLKSTVENLGLRGKMDLKPVIDTVQGVIDDIKENGDEALLRYTERFDGVRLTSDALLVTEEEIKSAIDQIDPELLEVMKRAEANIRKFHEQQKESGFMMDVYSGGKIGVKVWIYKGEVLPAKKNDGGRTRQGKKEANTNVNS